MSTHSNTSTMEARETETACVLCGSIFSSEPGPSVCGPCLFGSSHVRPSTRNLPRHHRRALRSRWLGEARKLRTVADICRELGYAAASAEAFTIAGMYRRASGIIR